MSCDADTPIIVILRDDQEDKKDPTSIEATLKCNSGRSQRVELTGDAASKSKGNLEGETRASVQGLSGAAAVAERIPPPVSFQDASTNGITISRNPNASPNDAGISLVQVTLDDGNGGELHRTLIAESRTCNSGRGGGRKLNTVVVQSSRINSEGDIELDFDLQSLMVKGRELDAEEDMRFKVQARIGIVFRSSNEDDEVHSVVDVSAFLHPDKPKMVVHGGWIRRTLSSISDKEENEWDVTVEEAIVSDPEDGYHILAKLEDVHFTGIASNEGRCHLRELLSKPPTAEEADINDEMRQGRPPDLEGSKRGLRRLQTGAQKKILVHGYCSPNPFPSTHVSYAIPFVVSGSGKNNWSQDEFARNIYYFAIINGITSCGTIAHSQGGLATLHLYTYYWSCLDSTPQSGSKRMQSIGSPYNGSPLGNLAALGTVFGQGCGYVNDLTTDGASAWLNNIPTWARNKMSFYTTSFTDNWLSYDYCHLASDVLLGDPDDGAVEKEKGQLSGATNMGHKQGWCHSSGMQDPSQTTDLSRNLQMNYNAQY